MRHSVPRDLRSYGNSPLNPFGIVSIPDTRPNFTSSTAQRHSCPHVLRVLGLNTAMQIADIVIQSEQIKIRNWPHARTDCPSSWAGTAAPCAQCFCYVCDVPVSECDDSVQHAPASGRTPEWAQKKRCRRALVNTWSSIPDLVNLLISFSVDESKVRTGHNTNPSHRVCSPTSVNIEERTHSEVNVVKVLDYDDDQENDAKHLEDCAAKAVVSVNSEAPLVSAFCGLKIENETDTL